jgi:hypothetical protein
MIHKNKCPAVCLTAGVCRRSLVYGWAFISWQYAYCDDLKNNDSTIKRNRIMEINDLIHDAISNALTRRGLVEEEACTALSDEEAAKIAGGLTSEIKSIKFDPIEPVCPPILVGLIEATPIKKIYCPPILVGLIAVDDEQLLS